jgi:hypothetical protein
LSKLLINNHPAFASPSGGGQHVVDVFRAVSQILSALNPIRNSHSAAHPNAIPLDQIDAQFVCDTVAALFNYLNGRVIGVDATLDV